MKIISELYSIYGRKTVPLFVRACKKAILKCTQINVRPSEECRSGLYNKINGEFSK